MSVLQLTSNGLYCSEGDFYIDPWKPVHRAIITHAHSDHARSGHGAYLAHTHSVPLLKSRLGPQLFQSVAWKEPIKMNNALVTLYPAGHIIGSSQVSVTVKNETWVVSGDYKIEDDGLSTPFEPVSCNTFITECTFGLPVYTWKPQALVANQIKDWISTNHQNNLTSVLLVYSLGKAQRLLAMLAQTGLKIHVHGAIAKLNEVLKQAGWDLPPTTYVNPDLAKNEMKGQIVLAPPAVEGAAWMKQFSPYRTAVCSGWMQVRGHFRRRNSDAGFVISDHADWPGLLQAVKATGAGKVFTTHGFQSAFSRYLNENGIMAEELKTNYGNETEEE